MADSIFATDDVNGAAADDDQVIQFITARSDLARATELILIESLFNRAYSDTASAQDIANILAGKVNADAAVTADSGFVTNQGYVLADYFAEDYVGTTRTF